MPINLSDVQRIANLANLDFDECQDMFTLNKLSSMFLMVEKLRALNTEGIAPLSHPVEAMKDSLSLHLRRDDFLEEGPPEDYQKIAPATRDGLYLVPRVIE